MTKDGQTSRSEVRDAPVWQRIANDLRAAIVAGRYAPGAQLPPERQLAETYGASRVTTRRALTFLENEGLLRIEHGNGTFVTPDVRVRYALGGDRVRFNQNLRADTAGAQLQRRLLSSKLTRGAGELCTLLGLADGADIVELQMAISAEERPVAIATYSYDGRRFKGLDAAFADTNSLTAALTRFGVADYRRLSTEITARLPTAEEARLLVQSKVKPVIAYQAIDVEMSTRKPITVMRGCFAAERVTVTIAAPDEKE